MEHDKLSQAHNSRLHRPATKCAIYKTLQIEYNYTMKTKQKLQDFVDSVVIPAMENNKTKWDCIFKRGCFPQNAITKKEYKGINWLMLNYEHNKKEYSKIRSD